jgi:D-glycero-D-manno-heptose 1,7-bisphosphate phosphatase
VTLRPAVFLDRDGTLIEDTGFVADPAAVRLLPGAAQAVGRLARAGFPAVVVTNQSGIARGLLTESQYRATEVRVDHLLAEHGTAVAAHYFCPHHPDLTGPCDCRKPGTLLYRRAADALGLDLGRSWWVGDRVRDIAAATAFGGRGILVRTGSGESEAETALAQGFATAEDLAAAADAILRAPRSPHYFPAP